MGANKHLDHLEDLPFLYGVEGVRNAIKYLINMRELLNNNGAKLTVTTKWDGAPAIIAGINPRNGKFFVATKSAFNKTPKLNFTTVDIAANHGSGELSKKLRVALEYLPKIWTGKNIYQGDFLFDASDLKQQDLEGTHSIVFKPNTIAYAAPTDSDLGRRIRAAKIGIVFHTEYSGSLENPSTHFAPKLNLKHSNDVFVVSAEFEDGTGAATLTKAEGDAVQELLVETGKLFHKLNAKFINDIAHDPAGIQTLIQQFTNQTVRGGTFVADPKSHSKKLIEYIREFYQKKIDAVKTEKSKDAKTKEMEALIKSVMDNKDQFEISFHIQKNLQMAKLILVKKLESIKSDIKSFKQVGDDFVATNPEGFVAVMAGKAVKFIDRLEFSRTNFLSRSF